MTSDYTGDGQDDRRAGQGKKKERILEGINLWQNNGTATIFNSSPTNTFALPVYNGDTYNKIPTNWKYLIPGDYDGDGAMDYITTLSAPSVPNKIFISFPSKNVFNLPIEGIVLTGVVGPKISQWTSASAIYPIDFDGDGKQELLLLDETGSRVWSFTTTTSTCTVN